MKRNWLLLFLLILLQQANAQKSKKGADTRLAGLDTALSTLLKDWNAAGFAVAIVEKDKVIYSKGFGYRDYAAKQPVTPNTLFAIGSCTKAFTASLLGLLEKDGKLSLDKKVVAYVPSLHFYNNEMNDGVTIRDMMCHRTGLPRHDYSWYLFTTRSRDSLVQRLQYLQPSAPLREKWQYNNFMFLTQGVVAEKITGKSWEENIKEKIFIPLGMQRSNFSVTLMEKDADASLGYMVKNDSIIKKLDYYNLDAMGPAGSINSSVTEMANWVITWINKGKFQEKEVLPPGYIYNAISAQMPIGGGVPDNEHPDVHFSNYGLGWTLSSYRGHYRVDHGGNIDGFSANTCFFPSDSIGIIVLANQNASRVPTLARNIIADRLLKLKYVNWNGDAKKALQKSKEEQKNIQKAALSSRVEGTKPSHPLTDYTGSFNHPGYGDVDVYQRNDSVFAITGKDSVWLRHYHYDIFEVKGYDKEEGLDTSSGGTKINFHTGDDGKISSLTIQLEPAVKPLEFVSKPRAKPLDKEAMEKYTGEYELGGMTVKVYIKGSTLVVFVPGQPEYETIYTGNHSFKLKALDGYSVLFDVEHEKATSVSFIQPNGTFKAMRKNL
ncbi:MAG: serine hydrolase [Chitinophagaceae bacterium]|nr:serine hydrolase [Chitinophagaceae bacterium]